MINLSLPETRELKPRITVVGVGGAGGNAVNNMIASGLAGVDFLVANTDAQALANSLCQSRVQLGADLTQGLGAGSKPEVGRDAAVEVIDDIRTMLSGSHMIFITAGMGGGTGTGAAPVIARMAREMGILTVGVVTKPFQFEGSHRKRVADNGIQELSQYVDTLIIIPNQNLFRVANEKTTFADAFKMADNVLQMGVRGITDLMVVPGLINLDFNDVKTVMGEMGKAMMGTGEAEGERRAIEAAEKAINNPLLDDISMKGARGVLINITGGPDLTLFEVDEAANRIRAEVDPDANIIVGSALDESLAGKMRVSVVATGIGAEEAQKPLAPTFEAAKPAKPAWAAPQAAQPQPQPQAAAFIPSAPVTPDEMVETVAAPAPTTVASAPLIDEDADEKEFDMPVRLQPETASAPVALAPVVPPLVAAPAPVAVAVETPKPVAITPDPFREAEALNAAREQTTPGPVVVPVHIEPQAPRSDAPEMAPKRKPSLFERMMGMGSRQAEPPVRQEPNLRPLAPANVRATQAQLNLTATALEPLEGAEKKPEDDLLEIPAFLRRQAN